MDVLWLSSTISIWLANNIITITHHQTNIMMVKGAVRASCCRLVSHCDAFEHGRGGSGGAKDLSVLDSYADAANQLRFVPVVRSRLPASSSTLLASRLSRKKESRGYPPVNN